MGKFWEQPEVKMFDGISMVLTMKKGEQELSVDFNFYEYLHSVYENNTFLGQCRLSDFWHDGWECVDKKLKVDYEGNKD